MVVQDKIYLSKNNNNIPFIGKYIPLKGMLRFTSH